MITVDLVKKYLYIPCEVEEDDLLIRMMISTATAYAKNATNYFDELYDGGEYENDDFIKQADFFILLYTSELYQNRNLYSITKGDGVQPTYMTQSLMLQLQTYTIPDKGDITNE